VADAETSENCFDTMLGVLRGCLWKGCSFELGNLISGEDLVTPEGKPSREDGLETVKNSHE